MSSAITDTGVRGFLKWFKGQQPTIYKKAAPLIAAQVPQAFSGYHDGGWKTAGLSKPQVNAMMNRLAGFGDDTISAFDPNDLEDVSVTASTIGAPATVDVATAANSGSSSSSITSAINSIINGASSLYMSQAQVAAQNQILQTNLARAAQGLPPLSTSLSASGVPIIADSSTTGILLIAGGGLLLLMLAMSGKRR